MTKAEREAVHRLWDEVADFSVADTDKALVHFMGGVSRLIHAGNAFWLGAIRMAPEAPDDPLRGWRPRANRYLHPSPVHDQAYRDQVVKIYRGEQNNANHLAVRGAGHFRSYRLRQVLPAAWFEGEYYRAFHGSRGFHDECYVTFPLHEDCESYFAFHRVGTPSDFSAREEAVAAYAVRGIKWFHRRLVLSYGVQLAEGPLSPTQRAILQLLLTGQSEKEIAVKLGQSPHTTHKHIREIFRKFGTNSRATLMSLWLGHRR